MGEAEEYRAERSDAVDAKLAALLAAGKNLKADVRELTHDLTAVVTLLGQQLGEPFRSQAAEIIAKRQTGGEGSR